MCKVRLILSFPNKIFLYEKYSFFQCYILALLQKNTLQSCVKKKTPIKPLTFDFQLEYEEAIIATPTSMTVSKRREDKSHGIKKTKR